MGDDAIGRGAEDDAGACMCKTERPNSESVDGEHRAFGREVKNCDRKRPVDVAETCRLSATVAVGDGCRHTVIGGDVFQRGLVKIRRALVGDPQPVIAIHCAAVTEQGHRGQAALLGGLLRGLPRCGGAKGSRHGLDEIRRGYGGASGEPATNAAHNRSLSLAGAPLLLVLIKVAPSPSGRGQG